MNPRAGPGFTVGVVTAVLLGLVGSLIVSSRWEPGFELYTPPQSADPKRVLAGYRGEHTDASGARWTFRLTPLYTDAGRQEFEAQALVRRLALAPGEPWRLRLDLEFGGARRTEMLAQARQSGLAIEDERGATVLEPIGVASDHGGPADPVRTLFATPQGVPTGSGGEWILWGPRPTGSVRAKLGPMSAVLEPVDVPSSEVEGPLAVLERAADKGKKTGSGTSETELDSSSTIR